MGFLFRKLGALGTWIGNKFMEGVAVMVMTLYIIAEAVLGKRDPVGQPWYSKKKRKTRID